MRSAFQWRPFLAAFLGAGAMMVAYGMEAARGTQTQVRYGWIAILPPLLLGVTVAGLALTLRRPAGFGLALANLSLTAACTHLFLALQLALDPFEAPDAKLWAALDIVGWAVPGVLLLLLLQMPMLPERRRAMLGAMALASLAMLARGGVELAREPTVFRGAGLVLGALACFAAVRVASPLVPARSRRRA